MDIAFKDPMYKEARELINLNNIIKLYLEDTFDYDYYFNHTNLTKICKRAPFEQIIETIEDLRLFVKYVNRIGMTITKVEVVE